MARKSGVPSRKALVERFRKLSTPTVSNALDSLGIRGIMTGLQPIGPGLKLAGVAFTVQEVTADIGSFAPEEAGLERIVAGARPGDVVVVDNGGAKASSGGELFMFACKSKGLAGMVVDGSVRDREGILKVGYPVFSRHVVPTTGRTRVKVVAMNQPVRCDGVLVNPGDIVVADGSGAAVVPIARAAEVLARAEAQDAKDARMLALLKEGLSYHQAGRRLKAEAKAKTKA